MKKKQKKSLIRRFTPFMGKKKILIPTSLFLSALSAILNILPFVFIWIIIRRIFAADFSNEGWSLQTYAWMTFAAAFAGVLIYFIALLTSHLAAFRVEVGMRKQGMTKMMDMPLGFFDEYSSGKIRKIIDDQASTTHSFLAHQLPDMAGSVIAPVILILLILTIDWRMGLASLVPIVLGFLSMGFMIGGKGRAFQERYYDALEEMSSESVEYIRGIPVVKTFGQSIFSFKRFYDSIIRYKDMVYAYTLSCQKPMVFYTVIMQAVAFFLIPMAIFLVGRGHNLELVVTDFIFYLLVSPMFTVLVMRSMHFQQNALIAEQAIDRFDKLLEYETMPFQKTKQPLDEYSIEYKDVVFGYRTSKEPVIKKMNFKLQQGETVALVGPSGGGKTTIARLASRFWDVTEGEILIGGRNIKEIPKEELMNHISLVFQNTQLFKGTLYDNIAFGQTNLDEQSLNSAIDMSRSREIIDGLDQGLETIIGSKGTYLSGGEKQRITIARAIVKDAPIVILDEATAFADPENEHLIQQALKELSHGKTTLMIAHRLTTVQDADRILVVKDGEIVETGKHEQLLAQHGIYEKMWQEYQQSLEWKISEQKQEEGVVNV